MSESNCGCVCHGSSDRTACRFAALQAENARLREALRDMMQAYESQWRTDAYERARGVLEETK